MNNKILVLFLILSLFPPLPAEQRNWENLLPGEKAGTSTQISRYLNENLDKPDLYLLLDKLQDLDKEYLYLTEDQDILFDTVGDPLVRGNTLSEIATDKAAYQKKAADCQDTMLKNWNIQAAMVLNDLQDNLPEEYRGEVGSEAALQLDDYERKIRREMDQIICYSLNRFTTLREDDTYSLRKKTEAKTATELAEGLIHDLQDELSAGMDTLKDLPLDQETHFLEESVYSPSLWEERFESEFQKGLEKWEEAEKTFLSDRIEWELRLEEDYTTAEETWDDTFNLFSRNRKEWMEEMQVLYKKGVQQWEEEEQAFSARYQLFAEELETTALEQERNFQKQVSEALTIYRESVSLKESTQIRMDFYNGKVSYYINEMEKSSAIIVEYKNQIASLEAEKENYRDKLGVIQLRIAKITDTNALSEALKRYLLKQVSSIEEKISIYQNQIDQRAALRDGETAEYQDLENLNNTYTGELNFWQELKDDFQNQIVSSAEILYSLQTEAENYDPSVPAESLQSEIARMTCLSETLARQVEISEAVLAYAEMDSSLRPRELETQENYERANETLLQSEKKYNRAQENLKAIRESLKDLQENLDQKQILLETAAMEVDDAEKAYKQALEIYNDNDLSILEKAINNLQEEMKTWFTRTGITPSGREKTYIQYIQAAHAEWKEEQVQVRSILLRDLKGEEFPGEDNSYNAITVLEEKFSGLQTLIPAEADNKGAWEQQLLAAGLTSRESEYILLWDAFDSSDKGHFTLKSLIRQLTEQAEKDVLPNRYPSGFLENGLEEVESSEKAEDYYYLEKSLLILEILNDSSWIEDSVSPYKAYIQLLKKDGYIPDEDSIGELSGLSVLLEYVAAEEMTRTELLEQIRENPLQVEWIQLLSGEKTDILPFSDGLDLFLSESRHALVKAEQKEQVLAIAQGYFKESENSDIATEAEQVSTLEEMTAFYVELQSSSSIPSYFYNILDKYFSVRFDTELSRSSIGTEIYREEMESLQDRMEALEASDSEDETLALLQDAGYESEIGQIRSYLVYLKWQDYLKENDDPGMALSESWLGFEVLLAAENPNKTGEFTYSDIESLNFNEADYTFIDGYTLYGCESVENYLDCFSTDLDFTEKVFLVSILKGNSFYDTAVNTLKTRIGSDLLQAEEEYIKTQHLERIQNIRKERSDLWGEILFFRKILETTTGLINGTVAEEVQDESSGTYLNTIISMTSLMESKNTSIEKLKDELTICRDSRETYKTAVVDRNLKLFQQNMVNYQNSHTAYQELQEELRGNMQDYLNQQNNVKASYQVYQEARENYQLAREILEYAECAYLPETTTVQEISRQRREKYEKAQKALQLLISIRQGGETQADPDAEWSDVLKTQNSYMEAINYIGYTRKETEQQMSQLTQLYENTSLTIMNTVKKCFHEDSELGATFHYDPEGMLDPLSDCTVYSNGNLGEYFQQENISSVFTKDTIQWTSTLAARPDSHAVLNLFCYAYYHEFGGTVNLFENPQHQNLLAQDGDFLRNARIGYEGDMEKYIAGGYTAEEVTKVLYISNRVFITPESWLSEKTSSYFSKAMNTPDLKNLYSFFKIMMKNGLMIQDIEQNMSKELSGLAWEYLDAQSGNEQNRHKDIFGNLNSVGKAIRSKRETLNNCKNNGAFDGISEREMLLGSDREISLTIQTLKQTNQAVKDLSKTSTITAESLSGYIKKSSGIKMSYEIEKIISDNFPTTLNNTDYGSALLWLTNTLNRKKNELSGRLSRIENELSLERKAASQASQTAYSTGDMQAYEQSARLLFNSPSYLQEDFNRITNESLLSIPSYSDETCLNNMETYAVSLLKTFKNRLSKVKEVQYSSFQTDLEDLISRKVIWEERTNELIRSGMQEWQSSTERMINLREKWRENFQREYNSREGLWQKRYEWLSFNKKIWIKDYSKESLEAGASQMADQMGLDAGRLISEVEFALIPDMTTHTGSVSGIIKEALNGRNLTTLVSSVRSFSGRIGEHSPLSASILPAITNMDIEPLRNYQDVLKEQFSKALTTARALQMIGVVRDTKKMVGETIQEANEQVDGDMEDLLLTSGYARQGDTFLREAIIDSSLCGGNETESHRIGAYRFFNAPDFDHGVNLSTESLKNMDSTLIQARVQKAQENLQQYLNLIFGIETNSSGQDSINSLDKDFLTHINEQTKAFAASSQYASNKDTKGLFNYYLGYAPVMSETEPEKVASEGYGEMGRIFKAFYSHQARLYRGFSQVDTPSYNKKIWDDDADNDGESDSLLQAPTIRSLTDMALNIAISATLGPGIGNILLSTALNLVDDAVFTALDVDNGVMDGDQAWGGFAKKGAVSTLTSTTGTFMSEVDSWTKITGTFGDSLFEISSDIGIAGAMTAATTIGTAAINSYQGGWDFDNESLLNQISWENSKENYLSGMAGAGVGSFVDTQAFGFVKDLKLDADALSGLAGGLTSSALEYSMTDETTLNIMNMGIFGLEGKNGTIQSGLMELHLGSDNGSLLTIGSAGSDVSLGTLASAAKGLEIFSVNREINQSGLDQRLIPAMRALYSSELQETCQHYDDIINNKSLITFGSDQDYEGKTSVNSEGKIITDLNLEGKSAMDIAILLGHEALQDGIVTTSQLQNSETTDAVKTHMNLAAAIQTSYGSSFLSSSNNIEAGIYQMYQNGLISGS